MAQPSSSWRVVTVPKRVLAVAVKYGLRAEIVVVVAKLRTGAAVGFPPQGNCIDPPLLLLLVRQLC